jgi:hypothetical protein
MTSAERFFDPRQPRVETWWPYVSIGARKAVFDHPDRALHKSVLREIRRMTGMKLPKDTTLSEEDRQFLHAQADYD